MESSNFKVVLKTIQYREQDCFAIGFVYHIKLNALVKNLPFVQLNESIKTFYVLKKKLSLHRLYTLLQEKGVCPACSAKIEIKEKECHDCGLAFE